MTRSIALLLLATFLHACTSYHVRPITTHNLRGEVRVTLGGQIVTLQRPSIAGDSLIGEWYGHRRAVPLAEIRQLEVREPNGAKTGLLIVGIGVTALMIGGLVGALAPDPPPPPPPQTPSCGTDCTFSCPLVYSWDGAHWRLDSGTFGGAIMRALARTDVDNLDAAVAQNGELRLKVANELNETDHVDALSIVAVDHPLGVTVAPDGAGRLHAIGALQSPFAAHDFAGRDALARIRAADGWSWESAPKQRDTARVNDVRDGVELMFVRPVGARQARLVVDGNNTPWGAMMLYDFVQSHGRQTSAWYDSLNADPNLARRVGGALAREAFLAVAVRTPAGWEPQGLIWEAGPEIVKRQVALLDLGRVAGDTIHVRLESAPSFWLLDRVALDFSAPQPLSVREIQAASAVDGRGRDVRSLLGATDGSVFTLERGDFAELRFQVPEVPQSSARSYLLRSHGWYQIHTVAAGEPRTAMLARIGTEPYAISRLAVSRMNDALRALDRAGQ